ncbi:MAG TPA: glutathione S-transferase family protein [Steroidobacteraceae bacterium]|nr:glutathione S-transferase family protein [Steroidobacteraceae bacterium]
MIEPILHHFDWSPYAEKVRVLFGLKQLAWRSVQVPMVMPKPDLTALTGGYRKTPVLQIGADIYCDTSCIARELERRHPSPTLLPGSGSGLTYALAIWAERFFEPGAGLSMSGNEALPRELLQDRREFFTHMDFDRFAERTPHMQGQVLAHLSLLEVQLADGREFMGGARPGLADATAYYVVWMLRAFVADGPGVLARHRHVTAWEARVRALGHGERREIEAEEALAEARASSPAPGAGVAPDDPSGLQEEQQVSVTPDDYGKVPVHGELVTLDATTVAIRRRDPRAGEVVVHFPRLGYVVAAA